VVSVKSVLQKYVLMEDLELGQICGCVVDRVPLKICNIRRMASSEMLRRVALVRTDVSEELSVSISVTRIGELRTTLAVTSCVRRLLVTANVVPSPLILVTLMMKVQGSSETSILTRVTRHNIPENNSS
jgi:hypothetical protein